MNRPIAVNGDITSALLMWLGGEGGDRDQSSGPIAALAAARGRRQIVRSLRALARRRDRPTRILRRRPDAAVRMLDDPGVSLCIVVGEGEWIALVRDAGQWRRADGTGPTPPLDSAALVRSGREAIVACDEPPPSSDRLFSGHYGQLVASGLIINGCGLLLPLFSSLVYNKVIPSGHLATLWALVIGMLLFAGMELALRIARAFTVEQLAVHVDIAAERRLATRLLDGEHDGATSLGAVLSRYRDHAAARDALLGQYIGMAVDLPFVLLYLLAILIIAGPLLLVPVCAAGLMLAVHKLLHARAHRAEAESSRGGVERFTLLGELVVASEAWHASPLRAGLERRWARAAEAGALGRAHARFWRAAAHGATALSVTLSSVVILAVGVYIVEAHLLNVGGLIACSLLSLRAMALMASVVGLVAGLRQFRAARAALETALPAERRRETVPLARPAGELIVRRLGWAYPGRQPLFEDLTLTIRPGERIALIGATGSGKSTLLRCIAGVARPQRGEVLIDGIAVPAISPQDRGRWLAYKPQQPALFAGTLFDNLGGDTVDRARLRHVVDLLGLGLDGAGRFSLDQHLASGGTDLSGGQRQLVELARVLARDPAILLMDEPTAGLDAEAEQQIVRALRALVPDATVVMATHSARLISFATRVILLEGGRIAQDIPAHRLARQAGGVDAVAS